MNLNRTFTFTTSPEMAELIESEKGKGKSYSEVFREALELYFGEAVLNE